MIRKTAIATLLIATAAFAQRTTYTNDKGGSTTVDSTRNNGSVVKDIQHTNANGGTGSGQVIKDTDPRDGTLSTSKTYTDAKGRTSAYNANSTKNADGSWTRNRTSTGPGGKTATGTATGTRQSGTWSSTGRNGKQHGGAWSRSGR
jgi:hypothetical protein